jgi:type II secretory pathway component GspD/PulD (secretin)
MAEFRTALNLDPQNEFAQQRIRDALGPVPVHTAAPPQVVDSADRIAAKPAEMRHDIHYTGDSRGLLTAIAASYGLTIIFDDPFPSHHLRFNMENVDFATAMQAASEVTKSFSVPLEDKVLFAAVDSPENHRLYDRMGMRSFYIPESNTPQDLTELMTALRLLFEFKFVTMSASSNTITIRGPQAALEAATQFLAQLDNPRPEVMFDVKLYQVSHTYMRDIGMHVPNNFMLFNIPAAALAAVNLSQASSQTIAAVLAQLESQQNSIFSQPLATFGGGLTFMGLSLDHLSATLSMNESSIRELEHVQLRAAQEKDATFKRGERYPIVTASFSAGSSVPAIASAISSVLGTQAATVPVPSISYEDIGLTLKAKPRIHNNSDVAVELEIQFRTLGSTNTNGIPDILNREYKGGILLREGEPAVVAGMVTQSDERSMNGLPFFSGVPGFRFLTSENTKQEENDEILILITPYVIRSAERAEAPEIWVGK